MGRMAGPDPLFRLRRSIPRCDPVVEESVPRCWLVDRPGQRKTRRHQGGLLGGTDVRLGLVDSLRHSPNIFTSPSEASRKESVSTPSLVTGTSANDCMFKEISKQMVNEIGSCHFDCFEVWRYRGHLFRFFVFAVVSRLGSPDRTPASLPPGCLWRGRREKNLPNSERRKGYPERSPKACSFRLFGWPSQPGVSVCQSIRPWHECTQTSMLYPVQNGTTMVRNLPHRKPRPPLYKSLLLQQIAWKSNGTSQAGMKSFAGSVVENIQRFDNSVRPLHLSVDASVVVLRFSKERTSLAMKPA